MPKVTIWIRVEDEPKWQAIADKPEWLHEHLNGDAEVRQIVKTAMGIADAQHAVNPDLYNGKKVKQELMKTYCEHYQPKGNCLIKGCKYGKGKK